MIGDRALEEVAFGRTPSLIDPPYRRPCPIPSIEPMRGRNRPAAIDPIVRTKTIGMSAGAAFLAGPFKKLAEMEATAAKRTHAMGH